MKHFAILRHGKIKNGRHLVSVGLHNVRGAKTDNADKGATPPLVLIGSAKPHFDVRDQLKMREITKIRKNGNVAVEILLAASPDWWAKRGWVKGKQLKDQTPELQATLAEWVKLNSAYLRKRSGDRVASLVLHLDESTPHLQALVLPVQLRARKGTDDFKWRLDTEIEMGSPGRLIQRQTEYAKAMAPLGLARGKRGVEIGSEQHVSLKEHQEKLSQMRDEAGTALMNSQNMETWSTNTVLFAQETAINLLNNSKADAKKDREAMLAAAEASIAADRQKAADEAQKALRVALSTAEAAAEKIRTDARTDAKKAREVMLTAASAEIAAQRLEIEADRLEIGRDQVALKLERQFLDRMRAQMEAMLSKLAPLRALFEGLPEKVRAFADRDGQVAEAIKPGGILAQANALSAKLPKLGATFVSSDGPSPTAILRAHMQQIAEKANGR